MGGAELYVHENTDSSIENSKDNSFFIIVCEAWCYCPLGIVN